MTRMSLTAGLAQTRACQQPAEAAADDYYVNRIVQRLASEAGIDIRIVDVSAEVTLHFDVLFVAVRSNALVAFLAIFGAQRLRIEIELLLSVVGRRNFFSITHGANSDLNLFVSRLGLEPRTL